MSSPATLDTVLATLQEMSIAHTKQINDLKAEMADQLVDMRDEFSGHLQQLSTRFATLERRSHPKQGSIADDGSTTPSLGDEVQAIPLTTTDNKPELKPRQAHLQLPGSRSPSALPPVAPGSRRPMKLSASMTRDRSSRRVYARQMLMREDNPAMALSADDMVCSSLTPRAANAHASAPTPRTRLSLPDPSGNPFLASLSADVNGDASMLIPMAASNEEGKQQHQQVSGPPSASHTASAAGSQSPGSFDYKITMTAASGSTSLPETTELSKVRLGRNGNLSVLGADASDDNGEVEQTPVEKFKDDANQSSSSTVPQMEASNPFNFGQAQFNAMRRNSLDVTLSELQMTRRKSMTVTAIKKRDTDQSKINESLDPDSRIVSGFEFAYLATTLVFVIVLITSVHPRSSLYVVGTSGAHVAFSVSLALLTVFSVVFIALNTRVRCRRNDQSWILADDVSEIWRLYRSRWFGFDLFLAVPIEFIFMGWLPEAGVYIGFRQLLRVVRIGSMINSPNPVASNKTWFRFFTFCAIMVVIGHIAACGIWSLVDDDSTTYTDALYWSVATITSVGYGDIPTPLASQRVYAVFAMLCGVLLVSSFTAFTTQYLTKRDAVTEETERQKSMMVALLNHYRVPWEVAREIIAVFPSLLDNSLSVHFRSSVDGLPPFLRDQLQSYVNAAQLRRVPMFHNVTDKVLLSIGRNMHTIFTPAYDYIVYESEVADSLYVILRGVVEVSNTTGDVETVIAKLREGEYFGEMALLGNSTHTASVMAVVSSELLVLSTTVLSSLIEESEEVRNALFTAFKVRHGSLVAKQLTGSSETERDNPLTAGEQPSPSQSRT